ncbi:L-rhamnose mutarotase, partial [Salmonella enterica]
MNRYCFTLRVLAEHLGEYRRHHEAVWPEMQQALRETGWRNYSL